MPIVSLDHLTLLDLPPPQLVSIAAGAGFTHVGLRLLPVAPGEQPYPMTGDTPMRRETLARLRGEGVSVFDVGVVRLQRGLDPGALRPTFETAARLGARGVVINAVDPDAALLAELLQGVGRLAREHGLRPNLEPTPWSGAPTLAAALAVVQASDDPDACVLPDVLHLDRSGATPGDLAALPPSRLAAFQVCDAVGPRPADVATMVHQARHARAFPGEGDIDVAALLRAVPPGLPLSLEAPNDALAGQLTPLERAVRGRRAVDRLLQAAALCPPGAHQGNPGGSAGTSR